MGRVESRWWQRHRCRGRGGGRGARECTSGLPLTTIARSSPHSPPYFNPGLTRHRIEYSACLLDRRAPTLGIHGPRPSSVLALFCFGQVNDRRSAVHHGVLPRPNPKLLRRFLRRESSRPESWRITVTAPAPHSSAHSIHHAAEQSGEKHGINLNYCSS